MEPFNKNTSIIPSLKKEIMKTESSLSSTQPCSTDKSIQKSTKQLNIQTIDSTPATSGVLIQISPSISSNIQNISHHNIPIVNDINTNSKLYILQNDNTWRIIQSTDNQQIINEQFDELSMESYPIENLNLIDNVKKSVNSKIVIDNCQRKRSNNVDNENVIPNKLACVNQCQATINNNQFLTILQDKSTNLINIEEYNENLEDDTIVLPLDDENLSIFETSKINQDSFIDLISTEQITTDDNVEFGENEIVSFGIERLTDYGTIAECVEDVAILEVNNESDDITPEENDPLIIVEEALGSIEDDKLKEKALKALADIKKYVPLESQKNLIFQKEIIKKQNNKTDANEKFTKEFQNNLDEMLFRLSEPINQCNEDNKIMMDNPMVKKIYSMLKQDFLYAKKFDDNGLLNIHNAVLSNSEFNVQRQLLVLCRGCRLHVDVRAKSEETALELAIQHQAKIEIVKLLLQAGANPSSLILAHDSALTIACYKQSPLIKLLIKHIKNSKDLDHIDSIGMAAIHYCTQNGNKEAVEMLINAGADVNLRDNRSGKTAAFHALENGYIEITKVLLENGANAGIPTYSGYNLLTLYHDSKHYILKNLINKSINQS